MSRKSSKNSLPYLLLVLLVSVGLYIFRTLSGAPPADVSPTFVPPTAIPSTAISQTPAGGESQALPSWLKIYFTDPTKTADTHTSIDATVAHNVIPVLDAAQKTIDVASFDFNLPEVTTALVNAAKRGVQVRVVLDETNGSSTLKGSDTADGKDFDALKTLQNAKIKVVDGGRSNGLMHDKIIIVDGTTLFMGSWNMSYNDSFRNNNNLLQISSQKLITNYQAKFNELYVDKKFGAKSRVGAQTASMTLDGIQVENYFSPPDKVMDKLVAQVKSAQKSIKFIIFTYTHADLSSAMIERAKAGVSVQGVIENRGASQGALVPLFCAKLDVKIDGNKYTMHHKVIIIDDSTVITGSFNFTQSADDSNDDNVLIIHSPAIAALYNAEFAKVAGIAKVPTSVTCPAK